MRISEQTGDKAAVRARLRVLLDPAAADDEEPRRAVAEADEEEIEPPPEPEASIRLEPGLVERVREFGARHLLAIALVAAVGVAVAAWQLFHARPVAVAATPVAPASLVRSPSAAASSKGPILVHVLGAVRQPGVVTLPSGARVNDAIAAAGGLTDDADPAELNLAAVLSDGAQLVIGRRGAAAGEVRDGAGGSGSAGGASATAAQVDLNTATQAQLESLPGVGPVTAGKILAWRQQHGKFNRVEELGEIDGIGAKTLERLRPYVTV